MKVLLPLDDSPSGESALDAVASQFRPETTEVHVLHVVEWPIDLLSEAGPGGGPELLAARDRSYLRAESLVDQAVQRLRQTGFTATREVRGGYPREEIMQCAADWRPDVVVMGSHGRKGIDRFLLGSVSDGVLRRASCSVQIVRPPAGGTR
jgi:nucleotide-binding universal stress UspA family protein